MPKIEVDVKGKSDRDSVIPSPTAVGLQITPSYSRIVGPAARYEHSTATTEEQRKLEAESIATSSQDKCRCSIS